MEPISYLDRFGCATPGSVGIVACAIAGNDLNAWMSLKPGDERLGLAVWQNIDHAVGLQIDQEGSVAVALFPGEVIHPQDPWCAARWSGCLSNEAD